VPTAVKNVFGDRVRTIDLALMEDDKDCRRYFANNLGVGFDANVVIRTVDITQAHGFLKYFLSVLTTLAKDFYPFHLHMQFDGEEVSQEVLFISLGVGPRHGGGFLLTPDASHEDGKIDSCTAPMLGRLRALSLLNAAVKGTHIHTPYVTMRQNERIVIQSAEAMPIHVDGEIYARPEDDIHKLAIVCLPAALDVVY
jgi:diacylglycerol kinase (ATP)